MPKKSPDIKIIETMESLRDKGFCVVLKCLPPNLGWRLQGSHSEFDAPCPDRYIGKGKWCAESNHVKYDSLDDYIIPQSALGDTPLEAIMTLADNVNAAILAKKDVPVCS